MDQEAFWRAPADVRSVYEFCEAHVSQPAVSSQTKFRRVVAKMKHLSTPVEDKVELLGQLHAFVVHSANRKRLCALHDTFTVLDVLRAHRDSAMIQARGASVVQALAFGSTANAAALADRGAVSLLFTAFRSFLASEQVQTACVAAFAALIPHGDLGLRLWRRDLHTVILEGTRAYPQAWELLCFASKALRGLVLRVGTPLARALEAQGACRLLRSQVERVNAMCSHGRPTESTAEAPFDLQVAPGDEHASPKRGEAGDTAVPSRLDDPGPRTPDMPRKLADGVYLVPDAAVAARRLAADALVCIIAELPDLDAFFRDAGVYRVIAEVNQAEEEYFEAVQGNLLSMSPPARGPASTPTSARSASTPARDVAFSPVREHDDFPDSPGAEHAVARLALRPSFARTPPDGSHPGQAHPQRNQQHNQQPQHRAAGGGERGAGPLEAAGATRPSSRAQRARRRLSRHSSLIGMMHSDLGQEGAEPEERSGSASPPPVIDPRSQHAAESLGPHDPASGGRAGSASAHSGSRAALSRAATREGRRARGRRARRKQAAAAIPSLSPREATQLRIQGRVSVSTGQAAAAAVKEALRSITGTSSRRPSTAFASMVADPTFPYGLVTQHASELARAHAHRRTGAVSRARELRRARDGEAFAANTRTQRAAIRQLRSMGFDLDAIEANEIDDDDDDGGSSGDDGGGGGGGGGRGDSCAGGGGGYSGGGGDVSSAVGNVESGDNGGRSPSPSSARRRHSPSKYTRRLSASSILDLGLEAERKHWGAGGGRAARSPSPTSTRASALLGERLDSYGAGLVHPPPCEARGGAAGDADPALLDGAGGARRGPAHGLRVSVPGDDGGGDSGGGADGASDGLSTRPSTSASLFGDAADRDTDRGPGAAAENVVLGRGGYPPLPPYISPLETAEDGLPAAAPGGRLSEEMAELARLGADGRTLRALSRADALRRDLLRALREDGVEAARSLLRALAPAGPPSLEEGTLGFHFAPEDGAFVAAVVRGRQPGREARSVPGRSSPPGPRESEHDPLWWARGEETAAHRGGSGPAARAGPAIARGSAGSVRAPPLTAYAEVPRLVGRSRAQRRPLTAAEEPPKAARAGRRGFPSPPSAAEGAQPGTRIGGRRRSAEGGRGTAGGGSGPRRAQTSRSPPPTAPAGRPRGEVRPGSLGPRGGGGGGGEGPGPASEVPEDEARAASEANERAVAAAVEFYRLRSQVLSRRARDPSRISRDSLPRPYSRPGTGGPVLGLLSSWSFAEDGVSLRQRPEPTAGRASTPALPSIPARAATAGGAAAGSGPTGGDPRRRAAARRRHRAPLRTAKSAASLDQSARIYRAMGRPREAPRSRRAPRPPPHLLPDSGRGGARASKAAERLYAQARTLHEQKQRRARAAEDEARALARRTARGRVAVPTREERLARMAAHREAVAQLERWSPARGDGGTRGRAMWEAENDGLPRTEDARVQREALRRRKEELARVLALIERGDVDEGALRALAEEEAEDEAEDEARGAGGEGGEGGEDAERGAGAEEADGFVPAGADGGGDGREQEPAVGPGRGPDGPPSLGADSAAPAGGGTGPKGVASTGSPRSSPAASPRDVVQVPAPSPMRGPPEESSQSSSSESGASGTSSESESDARLEMG